MASITRRLSTRVDATGKAEILLRVSISRDNKQRIKSGMFVKAERFKDGCFIKPRNNKKEAAELIKLENDLVDFERFIIGLCQEYEPKILTKDFFSERVRLYFHPQEATAEGPKERSIYDEFNEYLEVSDLSSIRIRRYWVIIRTLARFEKYKQKKDKSFILKLDDITEKTLEELSRFIRDEGEIYIKHPDLYQDVPTVTLSYRKPRKPEPRGKNTIILDLKLFRAFNNWAIKKGYTSNYPFAKFTISAETYGTPFYLNIEERNHLAEFDFSKRPGLAVQRDIFIFQCLIGCRVSDLYRLTRDSIVNGAIEYMPSKTKGKRPEVVRVPLNPKALELIKQYEETPGKSLFPFISFQRYNDAIKEMVKLAGINRIVTILNPTTGRDEKRPIYELASSHMARRTFIGNLYKKVKDPNLVGSLSGHKEGSRAFARYREIDDDIKKELINLL